MVVILLPHTVGLVDLVGPFPIYVYTFPFTPYRPPVVIPRLFYTFTVDYPRWFTFVGWLVNFTLPAFAGPLFPTWMVYYLYVQFPTALPRFVDLVGYGSDPVPHSFVYLPLIYSSYVGCCWFGQFPTVPQFTTPPFTTLVITLPRLILHIYPHTTTVVDVAVGFCILPFTFVTHHTHTR